MVYKIHHGAGRISYFAEPVILLLAGTLKGRSGPVAFNRASRAIPWLARTAMGAVGAHNRGACPLANTVGQINIVLISQ